MHEVLVRSVAMEMHDGPLPSPETMRQYDAVVPGIANEIRDAWKAETNLRQETVRRDQDADRFELEKRYANHRLAMHYGFVLGLLIVALAFFGIAEGYPEAALAGIVPAIGVVIWAIRRDPFTGERAGDAAAGAAAQ